MNISLFDQWNDKKKITDSKQSRPHFRTGDIWWAQLGHNISTEVAGKGSDFLRPVLVLQRVYGNACIAIPLTTIERVGDYYHSFEDTKQKRQIALLAQIRYLDGKRLTYQRARMKKEDLADLHEKLYKLLKK